MNKCVVKNILLTGATGKLGTQIVQSSFIKNLLTPSRKELDIRQKGSVKKYFRRNKIYGVIHCAAIALKSRLMPIVMRKIPSARPLNGAVITSTSS